MVEELAFAFHYIYGTSEKTILKERTHSANLMGRKFQPLNLMTAENCIQVRKIRICDIFVIPRLLTMHNYQAKGQFKCCRLNLKIAQTVSMTNASAIFKQLRNIYSAQKSFKMCIVPSLSTRNITGPLTTLLIATWSFLTNNVDYCRNFQLHPTANNKVMDFN